MKKFTRVFAILVLIGLFHLSNSSSCNAADAPPNMAAGLVLQLLTFEKNMMAIDADISIHVVGSKAIADEFKRSIGEKIANRKISQVTESNSLPDGKIDILFIADDKIVTEAIAYTHKEKIISVTSKPELVSMGITLGIGMTDSGGQSITINMAASKEEGLDWKPAILKIAKAVQ